MPNSLVAPVMRATAPSRVSSTSATRIAMAAVTYSSVVHGNQCVEPQNRFPSRQDAGQDTPAPHPRAFRPGHFMESPPRSCSPLDACPRRTRRTAASGRMQSTREPKRIRPMRSRPHLLPRLDPHTMRRATSPAISFTHTSPSAVANEPGSVRSPWDASSSTRL